MGVQPKHWLVRGPAPEESGRLASSGWSTCVVIAETLGDAIAQGSAIMGVSPAQCHAERFTSGAPVYDPRGAE